MKRLPIMIISVGLLAACGTGQAGNLGKVPTGSAKPPSSTAPAASSAPAASEPAGTAQPSGSSRPSPPAPTVSATVAATPTPSPDASVSVQAWFSRQGKLFVTERTVPATSGIGSTALNALLTGPTAAESTAGLRSQIPAGTQLLGLSIRAGTATVNLSSSFTAGATTSSMPMRIAQVVYTLAQFPTVTGVLFQLNGQGVTVLGGVPVQSPQTSAMYAGYLPAITVLNPVIGTRVASPITVSGTADVFEAVVSVRVLDSAGHEIARTFSTASCGTGCRGNYSVPLSYTVAQNEPGTIEVFETSPKNGQPVNVQQIPVMLAA